MKEATRNTTPSNPAFQVMRATAISLTDNNQTVVSDEIRSDHMSGPEILAGRVGGEGFNFEFSNGHLDANLAKTDTGGKFLAEVTADGKGTATCLGCGYASPPCVPPDQAQSRE